MDKRFKLFQELSPEEQKQEEDRMTEIMLKGRLPKIELILQHASPDYPNRDRLIKLVTEMKTSSNIHSDIEFDLGDDE